MYGVERWKYICLKEGSRPRSLFDLAALALPPGIRIEKIFNEPLIRLIKGVHGFFLCVRCELTLQYSENRINYCWQCADKCLFCERTGRVRVWDDDAEARIFKYNNRLQVYEVLYDSEPNTINLEDYENCEEKHENHYVFDKIIKLICDHCFVNYDYCTACRDYLHFTKLIPIRIYFVYDRQDPIPPTDFKSLCETCALKLQCYICGPEKRFTSEDIKRFRDTTIQFMFASLRSRTVCFDHAHCVIFSHPYRQDSDYSSDEDNQTFYLHHTMRPIQYLPEPPITLHEASLLRNPKSMLNAVKTLAKREEENIIDAQEAAKLLCNLPDIERIDLIRLLIYVLENKKNAVVLNVYESTGVQWINCRKCSPPDGIWKNMYYVQKDCCNAIKYMSYNFDEDLTPILLEETSYCAECSSPLFMLIDAEHDSDYQCDCDDMC
ncbi:hypothetical protein AsGV103 [Agrotis segetum granulovirus]|uniref:Uncharacterized protein n=1 Tax=Agrotis segetum granulosis virus TaxID=10464 RepID=A0A023MI81_GVAS|nr:hypothetical protein AsGV103 [Agrotis segetum granulovirus]AHN92140.1 hypothetical protein AsGV101 [Agrotis segetum granulovirus]AKN63377.1 hypothetical protein AsGV103 [Agrotis segetum granulovirus]